MLNFTKWSLVVISSLSFSAFAITAKEVGRAEAHLTVEGVEKDVRNNEYLQKSLNQIFRIMKYRLMQRGFLAQAHQIDQEWQAVRSLYFNSEFSFLNLGDHAPLNYWLAEKYHQVESLLGAELCHIYHFDDIKIINFGAPVSFHPEGDPSTGLEWGEAEYLLHFNPLLAVLAYWTGDLACDSFLEATASMVCSTAMDGVRWGVEEYLAPAIGRRIYKEFN